MAGNFLVAEAPRNLDEHFTLAVGQVGRAGTFARAADELVQSDSRNIRAEKSLAGFDSFDRLYEILGGLTPSEAPPAVREDV